MAPALSLLSRTATPPTRRQATSTQSPLAVLALAFLHARPVNSAPSPLYAERDHLAEGPVPGFPCRRTVSSRMLPSRLSMSGFRQFTQSIRPKPAEKCIESARAIALGLEPHRKGPGRRTGTGECRPHLRSKDCSGVAECSRRHRVLYVCPADLQDAEEVIMQCSAHNRDTQTVTSSSRKPSQDARAEDALPARQYCTA